MVTQLTISAGRKVEIYSTGLMHYYVTIELPPIPWVQGQEIYLDYQIVGGNAPYANSYIQNPFYLSNDIIVVTDTLGEDGVIHPPTNTLQVTVSNPKAFTLPGGAMTYSTTVILGAIDEVTSGRSFIMPEGATRGELLIARTALSIQGNAEPNDLWGNLYANTLFGGEGDDEIVGRDGNDVLDGDGGNDAVYGEFGNDTLRGLDGDDRLLGGNGTDVMNGNKGADTLWGGQGADDLMGGQGNDVINGDGDNDLIGGNLGDDRLYGSVGADTINGGQQNDSLFGESGSDLLSGDLGDDTLRGGDGADQFVFNAASGNDVIDDFSASAGDRIRLLPGANYTISGDANAVLTLSTGGTITLMGVASSTVSASWFASA